jgi:hypothetical protein
VLKPEIFSITSIGVSQISSLGRVRLGCTKTVLSPLGWNEKLVCAMAVFPHIAEIFEGLKALPVTFTGLTSTAINFAEVLGCADSSPDNLTRE